MIAQVCYSAANKHAWRKPPDMPRIELPSPTLRLSRAEARRFLLMHQHLWPPRSLADKAGILDFIRHAGCIQYDPVNLVGQNPELVLQARVADYTSALLAELLYTRSNARRWLGQTGGDPSGRRLAVLRQTAPAGAPRARRPSQPADGHRHGGYGRDP